MWSTTERREIRNFSYPSVFELTGCQRLTNRCLHSLTRWIKKGIYWIEIVVRMNCLTGWRKKKEAEWLARTLKTEVAPFSSVEIGKKRIQFWGSYLPSFEDRSCRERTRDLMPNSGPRSRAGVFRTAVSVIRCFETVAEILGKSGKNLRQEDDRHLQANLYKIPLARKRENTLRRNPSKSFVNLKTGFSLHPS